MAAPGQQDDLRGRPGARWVQPPRERSDDEFQQKSGCASVARASAGLMP